MNDLNFNNVYGYQEVKDRCLMMILFQLKNIAKLNWHF